VRGGIISEWKFHNKEQSGRGSGERGLLARFVSFRGTRKRVLNSSHKANERIGFRSKAPKCFAIRVLGCRVLERESFPRYYDRLFSSVSGSSLLPRKFSRLVASLWAKYIVKGLLTSRKVYRVAVRTSGKRESLWTDANTVFCFSNQEKVSRKYTSLDHQDWNEMAYS